MSSSNTAGSKRKRKSSSLSATASSSSSGGGGTGVNVKREAHAATAASTIASSSSSSSSASSSSSSDSEFSSTDDSSDDESMRKKKQKKQQQQQQQRRRRRRRQSRRTTKKREPQQQRRRRLCVDTGTPDRCVALLSSQPHVSSIPSSSSPALLPLVLQCLQVLNARTSAPSSSVSPAASATVASFSAAAFDSTARRQRQHHHHYGDDDDDDDDSDACSRVRTSTTHATSPSQPDRIVALATLSSLLPLSSRDISLLTDVDSSSSSASPSSSPSSSLLSSSSSSSCVVCMLVESLLLRLPYYTPPASPSSSPSPTSMTSDTSGGSGLFNGGERCDTVYVETDVAVVHAVVALLARMAGVTHTHARIVDGAQQQQHSHTGRTIVTALSQILYNVYTAHSTDAAAHDRRQSHHQHHYAPALTDAVCASVLTALLRICSQHSLAHCLIAVDGHFLNHPQQPQQSQLHHVDLLQQPHLTHLLWSSSPAVRGAALSLLAHLHTSSSCVPSSLSSSSSPSSSSSSSLPSPTSHRKLRLQRLLCRYLDDVSAAVRAVALQSLLTLHERLASSASMSSSPLSPQLLYRPLTSLTSESSSATASHTLVRCLALRLLWVLACAYPTRIVAYVEEPQTHTLPSSSGSSASTSSSLATITTQKTTVVPLSLVDDVFTKVSLLCTDVCATVRVYALQLLGRFFFHSHQPDLDAGSGHRDGISEEQDDVHDVGTGGTGAHSHPRSGTLHENRLLQSFTKKPLRELSLLYDGLRTHANVRWVHEESYWLPTYYPHRFPHQQQQQQQPPPQQQGELVSGTGGNRINDDLAVTHCASDMGMAGALVHGCEDELSAVRLAAVDTVGAMAQRSVHASVKGIEFLIDMFNDDVESVRVAAMRAMARLGDVRRWTHVSEERRAAAHEQRQYDRRCRRAQQQRRTDAAGEMDVDPDDDGDAPPSPSTLLSSPSLVSSASPSHTRLTLTDDYLHTVLLCLQDASLRVRMAALAVVQAVACATIGQLTTVVDALLHNVRVYAGCAVDGSAAAVTSTATSAASAASSAAEAASLSSSSSSLSPHDVTAVYRCCRVVGLQHRHMCRFLLHSLMSVDPLFVRREANVSDPVYVAVLVLVYASSSSSSAASELPAHVRRHFEYCQIRHPLLFPVSSSSSPLSSRSLSSPSLSSLSPAATALLAPAASSPSSSQLSSLSFLQQVNMRVRVFNAVSLFPSSHSLSPLSSLSSPLTLIRSSSLRHAHRVLDNVRVDLQRMALVSSSSSSSSSVSSSSSSDVSGMITVYLLYFRGIAAALAITEHLHAHFATLSSSSSSQRFASLLPTLLSHTRVLLRVGAALLLRFCGLSLASRTHVHAFVSAGVCVQSLLRAARVLLTPVHSGSGNVATTTDAAAALASSFASSSATFSHEGWRVMLAQRSEWAHVVCSSSPSSSSSSSSSSSLLLERLFTEWIPSILLPFLSSPSSSSASPSSSSSSSSSSPRPFALLLLQPVKMIEAHSFVLLHHHNHSTATTVSTDAAASSSSVTSSSSVSLSATSSQSFAIPLDCYPNTSTSSSSSWSLPPGLHLNSPDDPHIYNTSSGATSYRQRGRAPPQQHAPPLPLALSFVLTNVTRSELNAFCVRICLHVPSAVASSTSAKVLSSSSSSSRTSSSTSLLQSISDMESSSMTSHLLSSSSSSSSLSASSSSLSQRCVVDHLFRIDATTAATSASSSSVGGRDTVTTSSTTVRRVGPRSFCVTACMVVPSLTHAAAVAAASATSTLSSSATGGSGVAGVWPLHISVVRSSTSCSEVIQVSPSAFFHVKLH